MSFFIVGHEALQSMRQSDMDLTKWAEYFIHGLSTQLQEVKSLGKQAIEQDVMIKQYHPSKCGDEFHGKPTGCLDSR